MQSAPLKLAFALPLLGMLLALARPASATDSFFDDDAQTPSPITDYFWLRASFFRAAVDTQLRLDPGGEPLEGTHLSGAQDLGYKSWESDGLAEIMFRLRDRNRITADYQELDQAGSTTLNRSVVFGSQVFSVGDSVSSSLTWRVLGLTWTYAFIQNDRFELAAGLGVHIMDLDVRGVDPSRFATYETSTAGALPTPALESVFRLTRKISLTARAEYLRGSLNGIFGSMGDFHADVEYRVVPNLSLGAGYSVLELKIDSVTYSNPGLVSFKLHGPQAFVRASF